MAKDIMRNVAIGLEFEENCLGACDIRCDFIMTFRTHCPSPTRKSITIWLLKVANCTWSWINEGQKVKKKSTTIPLKSQNTYVKANEIEDNVLVTPSVSSSVWIWEKSHLCQWTSSCSSNCICISNYWCVTFFVFVFCTRHQTLGDVFCCWVNEVYRALV